MSPLLKSSPRVEPDRAPVLEVRRFGRDGPAQRGLVLEVPDTTQPEVPSAPVEVPSTPPAEPPTTPTPDEPVQPIDPTPGPEVPDPEPELPETEPGAA